MSDDAETYWIVEFAAYAFDTEEQAQAFSDALTDAFCDMQEAKGYGASARVVKSSAQPAVSAPVALRVKPDLEDVAHEIYEAMRYQRKEPTPDWVKHGNSNAQVKARATAARIMAAIDAPDVAELVEALRPFAEALKGNYSHQSNALPISMGHGKDDLRWVVPLGVFRRAAAAIAKIGGQ